MWEGSLESIHITAVGGQPMVSVDKTRAVPGKGLEGDRYYLQKGTYENKPGAGRQITLIESEAIEALERENGIQLFPGETRRNLATRGVPLTHLVGKEFYVGKVLLRGIRLCEPCNHLEDLTQTGVLAGLVHRGGLRADILTEGIIQVGDKIKE